MGGVCEGPDKAEADKTEASKSEDGLYLRGVYTGWGV